MKGGIMTMGLAMAIATGAVAEPQRFATPEAAVGALISALRAGDKAAALAIFGPESEDVVSSGDAERDREEWGEFLSDAEVRQEIETTDARAVLYVGPDRWPFPAELTKTDAGWAFDVEGARDEVLARRIGHNELSVIAIMRRAADIQAAYRRVDHDGDGVMEFASTILSSPGARDGLYWPEEPGTAPSPFDDRIARASFTGFSEEGADHDPEPFEGYYFRILQQQGPNAPGGAYSYMQGGNMVAGHALVAYPAAYGETGVMSFLVGEAGVIHQADLGPDTLTRAQQIDSFEPVAPWTPLD